jgi:hypothetical protein
VTDAQTGEGDETETVSRAGCALFCRQRLRSAVGEGGPARPRMVWFVPGLRVGSRLAVTKYLAQLFAAAVLPSRWREK